MLWPDYLKRETLAKRLDIRAGAVDQYVKRKLIPPPIQLGEALVWRRADVDAWVSGQMTSNGVQLNDVEDPYLSGISNATPQTNRKAS